MAMILCVCKTNQLRFLKKIKNILLLIPKLLLILSLLLCSLIFHSSASALDSKQLNVVKKVVEAFKRNDRSALSNMVSYPLIRQDPLAPINNKSEFIKRFDEVFDRSLLMEITSSNIMTDWDHIGWQGVILNNGIVALDPDGNITEVNYISSREKVLISQMKPIQNNAVAQSVTATLHSSIKDYEKAIVELKTARFHVRVDSVGGGDYRYAAWPLHKTMSEKPDLVLNRGRMLASQNNKQQFVFDNGSYRYHLKLNDVSTKTPGSLEVFKSGQSWVKEVVTKVIKR